MAPSKSTIRQQKLRLENIRALGGRCSNPECRWQNDDGTVRCSDDRALQFDHKDSGGSAARQSGRDAGLGGLYRIKREPGRFQLLCANCNCIKARDKKERRGALQHRQPALVRRSLGQAGRRVSEPQELKDRREHLEFLKAEQSFLASNKTASNRRSGEITDHLGPTQVLGEIENTKLERATIGPTKCLELRPTTQSVRFGGEFINLSLVAVCTGISVPALSMIFSRKRTPRGASAKKIAEAIGMTRSAFLDGLDENGEAS
jgi:hypothetical protein